MTDIVYQQGLVIMRDGKIATGENCCCDGPYCCEPYEWRIRDGDDAVWFTGDIDFAGGQYRLLDFPYDCPTLPFYYRSTTPVLRLEVYGCCDQWTEVASVSNRVFECERRNINCFFFPGFSAWPAWPVEVPVDCRCQRSLRTGEIVLQDPEDPNSPCVPCPSEMTYVQGTGLGHLTTGRAVRFVGTVDGEGGNLANWEDANGQSPASALPDSSTNVVVDADLTSWLWATVPQVASLTLNGCQFGSSIQTGSLTATGATILADHACTGFPPVVVTVTGSALLDSGSTNNATIDGDCVFDNGSTNAGTITGAGHSFLGASTNSGTVTGDTAFDDGSTNSGTVTGDSEFTDSSNNGTVNGNATLDGASTNSGTVDGNATFDGTSINTGTVTGNATFAGASFNNANVNGDATFSGTAEHGGVIDGDATFNGSSRFFDGSVGGTATFNDNSCYVVAGGGTAGTFVPNPPPSCP